MQFKILDPKSQEHSSYWRWIHKYCKISETPWGTKITGAKDHEQISEYMSQYCLRRTADDVALELPELLPPTLISVTLNLEQRKFYERIKKDYRMDLISKYQSARDIPLFAAGAVIQNLRQFISVPSKYNVDWKSEKIEVLKEVLRNDVPSDDKVVIFSWYKDTAEYVAKQLGPSCLVAHGDVPPDERYALTKRFNIDPDVRYISATIGAMSEVVDLTAASVAIFIEKDWSQGANYQAIKRLHRHGQHKPVREIDIFVKDTYDGYIIRNSDKSYKDSQSSYEHMMEGLGFNYDE